MEICMDLGRNEPAGESPVGTGRYAGRSARFVLNDKSDRWNECQRRENSQEMDDFG